MPRCRYRGSSHSHNVSPQSADTNNEVEVLFGGFTEGRHVPNFHGSIQVKGAANAAEAQGTCDTSRCLFGPPSSPPLAVPHLFLCRCDAQTTPTHKVLLAVLKKDAGTSWKTPPRLACFINRPDGYHWLVSHSRNELLCRRGAVCQRVVYEKQQKESGR